MRRGLAGHTVVAVDAPGLVEEDAARAVAGLSFPRWAAEHPGGAIAFVQDAAAAIQGARSPPWRSTGLMVLVGQGRQTGLSCC